MRQQHNETRLPYPFGLTAGDELVNDALSGVGEVTKLSFPDHQRVRVCHRVSQLETNDSILAEWAVADSVRCLIGIEVGQRIVGGHVNGLVMQNMMALWKGASFNVLTWNIILNVQQCWLKDTHLLSELPEFYPQIHKYFFLRKILLFLLDLRDLTKYHNTLHIHCACFVVRMWAWTNSILAITVQNTFFLQLSFKLTKYYRTTTTH